jgi:2-isopropylmalate synthase
MKHAHGDILRGAVAVDLYDTTLRDGSQREGLSITCGDKIRIAQHLDAAGVSFIEGGWPGSNPKDEEFFARARDLAWTHATLAAFGSTRRVSSFVEDDVGLSALLESGSSTCTIFGKSSLFHVAEILRTTPDENLRMIEESVAFLRTHGRRVIYDAEHFFDAYGSDASYATETLKAAIRGGAEVVVLCDTNGGAMPWDIGEVVRSLGALAHPLGIHAHDDTGCAVASSLAAVRAGARHVQGTINGYGERCGNANLSAIAPSLELKLGLPCLAAGALARITELSHLVAEIANLAPDAHMAYVGRSAFAHKGGVHVAAIRRSPRAYEHIDPTLVGNRTRIVLSELSGKGSVLSKAEEIDIPIAAVAATTVLAGVKDREAKGFSFEVAGASVALLLRRSAADYTPPFRLIEYKAIVGHREGGASFAEATIKIDVNGTIQHTAAEGNGPVSALDAALRKALASAYPEVLTIRLADYKVRILDGRDGTSATTRVLIDSSDGLRQWTTVGAAPNILEASWFALADSIEYGLASAFRASSADEFVVGEKG